MCPQKYEDLLEMKLKSMNKHDDSKTTYKRLKKDNITTNKTMKTRKKNEKKNCNMKQSHKNQFSSSDYRLHPTG